MIKSRSALTFEPLNSEPSSLNLYLLIILKMRLDSVVCLKLNH